MSPDDKTAPAREEPVPEPPRADTRDPRDLREGPRSYHFEDWALI